MAGGEARVCVGPRSAVFAPLRDIGLIVVDEEHESSYKHEGDPRYDARARRRAPRADARRGAAARQRHAAARERRRRSGACGSAAASTAARCRRWRSSTCAARTIRCTRRRGWRWPTFAATAARRIVLLNRRGWSNFLSCRSCGHVWMCPNCEVALVLHRRGGFVACHHCGHRERVPERCTACGSVAVARHGAGTERIEHELQRRPRRLRVSRAAPRRRLCRDSAIAAGRSSASRRRRPECSSAPRWWPRATTSPTSTSASCSTLTQTLRFPDFRAEERTFALVTQLAGPSRPRGT